MLDVFGEQYKMNSVQSTKYAAAIIKITFEAGYRGIHPSMLKYQISQEFGISQYGKMADDIYQKLVNENGQYKDNALKMPENAKNDVIEHLKHLPHNNDEIYGEWLKMHADKIKNVTTALYEAYSENDLKSIAEAVQDHNVDYKIPETRSMKKTLAKDKQNRYEARSIYGMIVADADKTTDPSIEIMRNIKYATEKMVPEGNKDVVMTAKTQDGPIPIKTEDGKYIADMKKIKQNSMKQMYSRYNPKDGSDVYFQTDNKYDTDFKHTMYGQIQEVAKACNLFNPRKLADEYFEKADAFLLANSGNSSKAVIDKEAKYYDIDYRNGDSLFSYTLSYLNKNGVKDKEHKMPEITINDAQLDEFHQLDTDLSSMGEYADKINYCYRIMSDPEVPSEDKFSAIPEYQETIKQISKKNDRRNELRISISRNTEEITKIDPDIAAGNEMAQNAQEYGGHNIKNDYFPNSKSKKDKNMDQPEI